MFNSLSCFAKLHFVCTEIRQAAKQWPTTRRQPYRGHTNSAPGTTAGGNRCRHTPDSRADTHQQTAAPPAFTARRGEVGEVPPEPDGYAASRRSCRCSDPPSGGPAAPNPPTPLSGGQWPDRAVLSWLGGWHMNPNPTQPPHTHMYGWHVVWVAAMYGWRVRVACMGSARSF